MDQVQHRSVKLDSKTITYEQLAGVISHSVLKPELTEADVIAGCKLALLYNIGSVMVKPCHVTLAKNLVAGTEIKITTVIGFPHGGSSTEVKVFEAQEAIVDGAVELDMVINIGELRSGNWDYVRSDIQAVCDAAHTKGAFVKVILENAYLSDDEKVKACQISEAAGADWVKTSTGFAPGGATIDDIRLMRASIGPNVQIQAGGGVRTLDMLLAVIDAGCTRSGATATASILEEFKKRQAAV
jgi:deoxyribose-phosphate aldolase